MLRTYSDVCGAGEKGAGSDASDDRLFEMSRLWREGTYAELHRCLLLMREARPDPDPRGRSLYWHVSERYLRVQRRVALGCPGCGQATRDGVRHEHRDGTKNRRYDRGPIVQEVWRPGVNLERVDLGVDWLVRTHRGPPYLPAELYSLVAA